MVLYLLLLLHLLTFFVFFISCSHFQVPDFLPVEAANKILKYGYLFRASIYNRKQLNEHLENSISDFCFDRPHYTLGLYTPNEVHHGTQPKIDPNIFKNAIKERVESNRTKGCVLECI